MTLDEAIIHAREVAEKNRRQYKNCPADRKDIEHQTCEQCAKEHEQLAEWLEDYKRLKNIHEHTYDNCHNATCRRKCNKDGYNQAIDDFYRKMKKYMETIEQATYIDEINKGNDNYSAMAIYDDIDEIAEELKGDE